MPSTAFSREIAKQFLKPRFKFTYDDIDYSASVISISPLKRSDNLSAQYVTVTISDPLHLWDAIFRTDHTELTSKQAIISFCIGHIATKTSSAIQFHEGGAGADTITLAAGGLSVFKPGTVIAISGSSEPANNTSVMITSVTDTTLTLSIDDDLITNIAEVDLIVLETEAIPQFTGVVESAVINHDQGTISLRIRDRISLLLENKVGSVSGDQIVELHQNNYDTAVAGYKSSPMIISAVTFALLTIYGKLDDTNTTPDTNVDIDMDSFDAWAVHVDNGGYALYDVGFVIGGGPTVASVLSSIAKLTVSQIWVGLDGRIKFKASTHPISGGTYIPSQILSAQLEIGIADRKNLYYTKYGYYSLLDTWQSDTDGISAVQTYYGPQAEPYATQIEWEQDREVSHNTIASADLYSDESLKITGPPIRTWTLEFPLFAILEDVGNEITIHNLYATGVYHLMVVFIREIELDPMSLITTISGYYMWLASELA